MRRKSHGCTGKSAAERGSRKVFGQALFCLPETQRKRFTKTEPCVTIPTKESSSVNDD